MPSRAERVLLLSLTLGLGACAAGPSGAVPGTGGLCRSDERVAFQCPLEHGMAAVCAKFEGGGSIAAVSVRSGTTEKLEQDFEARAGTPLLAQTELLAPGAQLYELWFDRGETTTVLSQCVGGACLSEAGISRVVAHKLAEHHACQRAAHAQPWFSDWLLSFGDPGLAGQSATPAIVFGGADHPLDEVYVGAIAPR